MTSLTFGATLLALAPDLSAHGGVYRGPGDVVPPYAGGGGPRPPGPVTPGTPAPATPNPTTPSGGPPRGSGPVTPGAPMVPRGVDPRTATGDIGPDLTRWQFWWEFNKDPYLNLKQAVHADQPVSGSDEIFLGGNALPAKDRIFVSERAIREEILPALGRALEGTTNRDIASSCMIALAKIGKNDEGKGIELVRLFEKRLKSGDQEVRETAALALGLSAREEALADLVGLVDDSPLGRKLLDRSEVDDTTRSFATYSIGLLAHASRDHAVKTRALSALEARLADDSSTSRNLKVAAILALQLVGTDKEPGGIARAELTERVTKALLGYWRKEVGRSEQVIQAHAPTALAHVLGRGDSALHRELKAKLVETLDTTTSRKGAVELVQSAAIALGLLASPDDADKPVVDALVAYARVGKDTMTRHFATIALGEIGGERARLALLDLLAKGHKLVTKPWAALGLGVLARRSLAAGGDNAHRDVELGRALREELAKATAPEAKSALAIAIGLAGFTDAADDLRDQLVRSRSNDELCGYTAIGLALLDDQRSVPDLIAIVKTTLRRPELLKQAAIALGKLGDKTVTDVLLEMLTSTDSNIAKLSAVATAFSFIGDRRTITPLVRILFDDKLADLSRAFAAVALGGIADKELLPWNSKIACDLNYRASVETLTNQATGILDIL